MNHMLSNGVLWYTEHATWRSFNEIFLKGINNGLPMAQPWYGWIYVVLFVIVMIHLILCHIGLQYNSNSWWLHDTFSILPGLYEGNLLATSGFSHRGLVMGAFGIFFIARLNKLCFIQTIHFLAIWDTVMLMWRQIDVTAWPIHDCRDLLYYHSLLEITACINNYIFCFL